MSKGDKHVASRAAGLAQQLAAKFLAAGNYVFSARLDATTLLDVMPAASQAAYVDRYFEELGFVGLSVQSVGYEHGAEEPRVHVYVTKGPKSAEREIEGEGIPVVINRVGKVVVRPEAASGAVHRGSLYTRKGRIACGSSCAPAGETYAGTLGALVRRGNEKALFVLSNNHVLAACNHIPVGQPILSPSPLDAGPGTRAPGEVCRHADIVELRSGVPTLVSPARADIAIAQVTNSDVVSSWQGEGNDAYDTPASYVAPQSGARVKKFGRTTGLTKGTLEALINTPMPLPYKSRFFNATVWFQDVWTVRADPGALFALPGDSGSLVVTEAGDAAVGVLFAVASGGEYGFIISMPHIAKLFGGLVLVAGHGV